MPNESNSRFTACGGELPEGVRLESLGVRQPLPKKTARVIANTVEGLAAGYQLVWIDCSTKNPSAEPDPSLPRGVGTDDSRGGSDPNRGSEKTNVMIEERPAPQVVYVDRPSSDLMANSEVVQPTKGRDLQRIHVLLRGRYHWAILLSLCLGSAAAIAGFRLGQKTYQSSGVIRVMPVVPKIMYAVDEKGQMPAFDTFVDAQVTLVKSQRVINQALDDKAWGAFSVGKSDQAMIQLTNSLDVSRQGDMICVKATNIDPQIAMISVNTVISAYTNAYAEIEAQSDGNRRALREKYRSELEAAWDSNRERILNIAKQYGSDDLKPQYDFKLSQLNELETTIGKLRASLIDATNADSVPTTTQPVRDLTADELASIDPRMDQLLADQSKCERQVAILDAQGIGRKIPSMILANAEVEIAKDDVNKYLKWYNDFHKSHAGKLTTPGGLDEAEIRERIKTLQGVHDASKADLILLGGQELEIEDLRSKGEDVKAELGATNHAIEQLDLESQATGRISVMNMADKPLAPFRDTRPTYAAAGALGGIVLGFGSIMLIGLVGRRLDRPEDARTNIVGIPLLGVLAKLPEDLADLEQAAITSYSVNQIRMLLQIMGQGTQQQVFGITSPAAGTGKTSLTLALGISFAAAQMRTLMIDCDLVGGGLTDRVRAIPHQMIGKILQNKSLISEEQLHEGLQLAQQSNRRLGEVLIDMGYVTESQLLEAVANQHHASEMLGVLDALRGEDIGHCVRETGVDRLSILPLGGASPQHAGRLSPNAFYQMIEAARKRFDVVLVDTGPVPGSLEASVVASQVDAVILAVSRGEQAEFVDASISHLHSVGAKIAGLVFNRARNVDVLRYGSSGMASTSRNSSITRLNIEMSELTPESKRFGPVALAVASHVPAPKSKTKSS
jgi:polysaccharide biosynthesis transport protein